MKTFCLTTMIVVSLLLCSNGIQAQTTQSQLNQVELMKQFIGIWKAQMGKDTIFIMEGKTFGKGLEFYWKTDIKRKDNIRREVNHGL